MRCPTCDEVVDPSMLLRAGRTAYLVCWNGHRFGLDGELVAPGSSSTVVVCGTTVAVTGRASSECAAG